MLLIAGVAAITSTTGQWADRAATLQNPNRGPQRAASHIAAAASNARRVYPYSVIPGGVRSRQELAAAIARDRVVAAHYEAVSIGGVRAEEVKQTRLAYMSYRIGNNIYWTSHKVPLNKGEMILTDGITQIRSRCGNCISQEPMQPTSEDEPTATEFEGLAPAGETPTPVPAAGTMGAGTVIPRDFIQPIAGLFTPAIPLAVTPGPIGSVGRPVNGALGPNSVSITPTLNSIHTPITSIVVPSENGSTPSVEDHPSDVPSLIVTNTPSLPEDDPLPPSVQETTPVPEPATLLLLGSGLALLRKGRAKAGGDGSVIAISER